MIEDEFMGVEFSDITAVEVVGDLIRYVEMARHVVSVHRRSTAWLRRLLRGVRNRRLARGEIDRAEYDEKRSWLAGDLAKRQNIPPRNPGVFDAEQCAGLQNAML
jgi:hypothetical protein